MAKQSGLGDNFYIGGYDLSGDINSLEKIGGGPNPGELTGIDKYAFERTGLLLTGGMDFSAWFNKATDQEHLVLGALPRTDVIAEYRRGTALGGPVAAVMAKQVNYDGARAADGSFPLSASVQCSAGFPLEWGVGLTAGKRTDTTATNGTSVDFAAAGLYGAQAYLQVYAFTGTSVTVKVQSSSDNAVGDPFADIAALTFTPATGRTFQRLAVTGGVERYLRVATTGTFSNAIFSVAVVVNATAIGY